jgi:hypothetical protein
VLLAAGIGSRFGGIKPLAPVGPAGEPLLAVSLGQAAAAGFVHVVIVVSERTEQPIRAALDDALGDVLGDAAMHLSWARQVVPAGRTKPLGTVDAVLSAGVSGDMVVANGDDLYGVEALAQAVGWIGGASTADAAAVLFRIAATLPASDGVSRALVEVVEGRLASIVETRDVHRHGATIRRADGDEVEPDALVSMNLWCLRASAVRALSRASSTALSTASSTASSTAAASSVGSFGSAEHELGLPDAIGELVRDRSLTVDAVVTDSIWHGVTWPGDVETVRAALRASAP